MPAMRYWVYLNGEVPGSYDLKDLVALPGFAQTSLVCPAAGEISDNNWKLAGEIPELIEALRGPRGKAPEQAPPPPPAEADVATDAVSARLISHMARLSKDFETVPQERALLATLQRHLLEMKEELDRERRARVKLESRLEGMARLEEGVHRTKGLVRKLHAALDEKESRLAEAMARVRQLEDDLARARPPASS